jgi:hypothetical protein
MIINHQFAYCSINKRGNKVNLIKTKQFFVFLSLLCAIGVFLMSSAFQSMAYLGNDLTWYWVGVTITYFFGLMGIVFLVVAITRKAKVKGKLIFGLSILGIAIFIILICGFLWTTFVIIAGMSGM